MTEHPTSPPVPDSGPTYPDAVSPPPAAAPASAPGPSADAQRARAALLAVRAEVAKAVVGQDAAVTGLLVALLCRGHILLEGVPGVAKTLLVRALAAALDVETKRVQFTPDLMPGDITGSLVFDARRASSGSARARSSPTCCSPTRSTARPPKTQSALLEAMEERQVKRRRPAAPAAARRSWSSPPRTPSSTRAPTRCPRPSSTGSCSRWCCPCPSATTRCRCCAGTRTGFDPRDLAAAGIRPVATASDLDAGAAAVREVAISDEVATYIVDIARATRVSPSLAGRLAAWRDRADGDQPGLGLAGGPRPSSRPTTSRRSPTRRSPTGSRCAPRPSSRASASAPCSRARSARCPSPADGSHLAHRRAGPAGAGTGRRVAARVDGALVAAAGRRARGARRAARAPAQRAAVIVRGEPTQVRLGETTTTNLWVTNTSGRGVRGLLRDAWPPSAGAVEAVHELAVPPHERVRLTTHLVPTRRGDRLADRVTVRVLGPLGLAARQRSVPVPGSIRALHAVPLAQAPAEPAGGAAPARRPGGGADPRPGHRVRQPARLRRGRRRALDRLAGHRPAPAPRRAHLAARAAPPRRASCSTPRAPAPAGSVTPRAWTPRWMPRCC